MATTSKFAPTEQTESISFSVNGKPVVVTSAPSSPPPGGGSRRPRRVRASRRVDARCHRRGARSDGRPRRQYRRWTCDRAGCHRAIANRPSPAGYPTSAAAPAGRSLYASAPAQRWQLESVSDAARISSAWFALRRSDPGERATRTVDDAAFGQWLRDAGGRRFPSDARSAAAVADRQ